MREEVIERLGMMNQALFLYQILKLRETFSDDSALFFTAHVWHPQYGDCVARFADETHESGKERIKREREALEILADSNDFIRTRVPALLETHSDGYEGILKQYLPGEKHGVHIADLTKLVIGVHEYGVCNFDLLNDNILGGSQTRIFDLDITRNPIRDSKRKIEECKVWDQYDLLILEDYM